MVKRQFAEATCDRRQIAPCVALFALNGAMAVGCAVFLLASDAVPAPMAQHGALMIVAWGCLLPTGGIVARYFKIMPGQNYPAVRDTLFWWHVHRGFQYTGVALATAAAALMIRATGGAVGSLHGWCGLTLMGLAWLQVATTLFRGTKGGPTGRDARADDPATWRGDHFDMTPRRRLFEAWHKPAGWALIVAAQGTILLGIDTAGAPPVLLVLAALVMAPLGLAVVDSQVRGRWADTHVALWGPRRSGDPDQPGPPVTDQA